MSERAVAHADADYVLRWLYQTNAPPNIVGLQERAVAALAGVSGSPDETRRRIETIRENVSHIARGCRASTAHNPAPYLNSIEAALVALAGVGEHRPDQPQKDSTP